MHILILIDKLILFGLCLLALSFTDIQWISVITVLGAVAVSSLNSYFENKIPVYLCVFYIALCLCVPECVAFLPLIVYDCAGGSTSFTNLAGEGPLRIRKWVLRLCWIVALPACLFAGNLHLPAVVVCASGAAFLLQYRTSAHLRIRSEFFALTDDTKERAAFMEQKNRDLMERQDYEIRLATLAERNRIAREIHDNVGHLLTRSILQLGALRVARTEDGSLVNEVDLIKGTLSDAMDSIRNSVHDLHDDSVDLRVQLETMINGFKFCPVKLRYDAGELPGALKYCFASIVREALSNIARHSHATEAYITVTEHPAFCQMIIGDNGTARNVSTVDRSKVDKAKADKAKADGFPVGIGLRNMADRVEALGGIFRTEQDKGFKIFISVPKGDHSDDNDKEN